MGRHRLIAGLFSTMALVAAGGLAPAGSAAPNTPPQAASSQIRIHVEPADGYAPIIETIRAARQSIDFWIYEFNDGRIARELRAAEARGVDVRVIFSWQLFPASSNLWNSQSPNYNSNMPTFNALKRAGVEVKLSPFWFTYSHAKSMVVDGRTGAGQALIMDFNAQPSYIVPTTGLFGTRGFAITTVDQGDVSEIQRVFDADWDRRQAPAYASPHLVWSPSGDGYRPKSPGKDRIFALLDSATTSLDLYVLLLDSLPFQDRLIAAARRGVDVRIITNTDPPAMAFEQVQVLSEAGIRLAFDPTYPSGPLFIHSKAIIADAGSRHAMAFVGSQNPGDTVSLNSERELGIIVDRPAITNRMRATFEQDWSAAKPLQILDGLPKDPYR
jgi:phosphatidylserine/phosphatidylglycerophosphate/cardiolipin synthase-like enzyme